MGHGNHVLDSISPHARELLRGDLVEVQLQKGDSIYAPGEIVREIYFPTTSLISVVATMGSGKSVEAAIVGKREVAGLQAFLGRRELAQTRTFVQIAGAAFRVVVEPLRRLFDENQELRDTLLRSVQTMFAQVSRNAACNRLHALDRRFARWLLDLRDRLGRDYFALTQELAGEMLGVRRVTITEVESAFARRGWIVNRRGSVEILDAHALLESACECHTVLLQEFARLFPSPPISESELRSRC
jgi:CRP-like cAMP-binding protein